MVDPSIQFCHNPDCPARGKVGESNIGVHSQKDRRLKCEVCGKTFAATKDTPFYRLHKAADLMVIVLILLCHGCPLQAIVAAFGLDERTVADWQARGGQHCQRVHEQLVQQGQVELQHVQADELWVKMVGKRVWMAMALAVPSRLWLGGVISVHRDTELITNLVKIVRSCTLNLDILVCVDGLSSYVTAFLQLFRNPVHTSRRGRPRLVLAQGLMLGQVVKQYAQRRVVSVKHKVVRAGDAGSYRCSPGGHWWCEGYQHGLHRAAQRHLPGCPGPPGSSGPSPRPRGEGSHHGYVPGWLCLQLRLVSREPPVACS